MITTKSHYAPLHIGAEDVKWMWMTTEIMAVVWMDMYLYRM
jgi:hypothetical protein